MLYSEAWSMAGFGLVVVASAQLGGCATSRDVTRRAGATIGGIGELAVQLAMSPDCDPGIDICPDDDLYYEEDTLEARSALSAGGGVAMLVGSGMVAAAQPPKKPKRGPAQPLAAAPAANVQVPESLNAPAIRELIERRCVPEGAIDLRVHHPPGGAPTSAPPARERSCPRIEDDHAVGGAHELGEHAIEE